MTVTSAFIGFTRMSPWNGNLHSNHIAPISLGKKNWLSAVKSLGEGIFFIFNQEMLSAWTDMVVDRYKEMAAEMEESFLCNDRFSPRYVALHIFAHLLIRQLADPLCGNSKQQGFHSLNYAACHDCVLLPETSCEFRNVLLDRIAVVGKPEDPSMGIMGNIAVAMMGECDLGSRM